MTLLQQIAQHPVYFRAGEDETSGECGKGKQHETRVGQVLTVTVKLVALTSCLNSKISVL